MGPPVPVVKTGNGRMSEAQAAVALSNLDKFSEYQRRNEWLFGVFRNGLAEIPGLELRVPSGVSRSNHQNLICLVDEASFGLRRDDLWEILRAENLLVGKGFYPSSHRVSSFSGVSPGRSLPNAERYSERTIELPANQALMEADVARLIDLLAFIHHSSGTIRNRLAEAA